MKKLLFSIAFLILATTQVLALSPKDLVGKWESVPARFNSTDEGYFLIYKYIFEFKSDNTATVEWSTNMAFDMGEVLGEGVYLDIFPTGEYKGPYQIVGDSVIILINNEAIKQRFTKGDIIIRGITDEALYNFIHEDAWSYYKNIDLRPGNDFTQMEINNVVVTGNRMTCIIDDGRLVFNRK